jgi:hypothetical protein
MAEIPDVTEFVIEQDDGIEFTTKTNGDAIRIHGVHLTATDAAALARLINLGVALRVEIKEN